MHPRVIQAIGLKIQRAIRKRSPLILVEAALHFESGYYKVFEGVILVDVSSRVQKERLMARDHLTKAEAKRKIESQWPLARKRRLAQWVIDNSKGLKETKPQVLRLYEKLV